MSIKQKIRSAWKKVTCKHGNDDTEKTERSDCGRGCGRKRKCDCENSELAAEEVIQKEVYPDKPIKKTCKKTTSSAKPASKRTRPTNNNYRMIDKEDGTCDSGKS